MRFGIFFYAYHDSRFGAILLFSWPRDSAHLSDSANSAGCVWQARPYPLRQGHASHPCPLQPSRAYVSSRTVTMTTRGNRDPAPRISSESYAANYPGIITSHGNNHAASFRVMVWKDPFPRIPAQGPACCSRYVTV